MKLYAELIPGSDQDERNRRGLQPTRRFYQLVKLERLS